MAISTKIACTADRQNSIKVSGANMIVNKAAAADKSSGVELHWSVKNEEALSAKSDADGAKVPEVSPDDIWAAASIAVTVARAIRDNPTKSVKISGCCEKRSEIL